MIPSPEELTRILGRPVRNISPLQGKSTHPVFRVLLQDGTPLVMKKVREKNPAQFVPSEPESFPGSIPSPVASTGDWQLATWAKGRPLLNTLLLGGNRAAWLAAGQELASRTREAGRWLNAFRQANPQPDTYTRDRFLAKARHYASQISLLNPQETTALLQALESVPDFSLPMVLSHGDFAPRNILFEGRRRISVIDWDLLKPRPAHYDACYFIMNILSRSRHPAFSPVAMKHLARAFLEGYSAPGQQPSAPALQLNLFRLYALRYVYEYETLSGVFAPWPKPRAAMTRFIQTRIRNLLTSQDERFL